RCLISCARSRGIIITSVPVAITTMLLMQVGAFLAALGQFAPDMASRCAQAMAGATHDGACVHPDAAAFAQCPSNSIDYAVMERAENVVVAPVNPGWSDVGSWSAIHALSPADANGNVIMGDSLTVDANGNLLRAADGIRISLLGVSNMVVIATGTEVMIIPRERAQDIKHLVEKL
ncbi:MAG: hypothetical protein ACKOUM_08085, partial [Sphingopyxis sp.]